MRFGTIVCVYVSDSYAQRAHTQYAAYVQSKQLWPAKSITMEQLPSINIDAAHPLPIEANSISGENLCAKEELLGG